jgi:Co/Zn/Cd efflux system component
MPLDSTMRTCQGNAFQGSDKFLRRVVALVALLNLAYFGIEFTLAAAIGSVSLFADSIDFLEDTALNLLILVGLACSATNRARLGKVVALVLLLPGVATIWTAWLKFAAPTMPSPLPLSLAGVAALTVNTTCAFLLARVRCEGGSLTQAAFFSARNDAVSNVAIILAGAATSYTSSVWPDMIVGLGIAALNADAATEVWRQARE